FANLSHSSSRARRRIPLPAALIFLFFLPSHIRYTLATHMSKLSRRDMVKTVISGVTMASVPSLSFSQQSTPVKRKGQIHQSVSRWCYEKIPLDKLCAYSAEIGLKGIDLLKPKKSAFPRGMV